MHHLFRVVLLAISLLPTHSFACSQPLPPPPSGTVNSGFVMQDPETSSSGYAFTLQPGDDVTVSAATVDPDTKVAIDAGTLVRSAHSADRWLWRPSVPAPSGATLQVITNVTTYEVQLSPASPLLLPVLSNVTVTRQKVPVSQCVRTGRSYTTCGWGDTCEAYRTVGYQMRWSMTAEHTPLPGALTWIEATLGGDDPILASSRIDYAHLGLSTSQNFDDLSITPDSVCVRLHYAGLDDVEHVTEPTCVTPEVQGDAPEPQGRGGCTVVPTSAWWLLAMAMVCRRRANQT